ncbi:hypothetical protein QJS10_CPA10g02001 [Acorus calamus]|uniref:Disease resistance N-terminal domain-containing protein n=1 Tax=Acorus calamus TaxID=4465 RepID=A0AAV9E171_ACOCL|nr:hypothetical protein QJS10_CPA10g02001 [Acorus calamus]
MAMIVDAFASLFIERLGVLVEEEVAMLLGVKDDLKKLERKMERLRSVLGDAQMKELQYRVQRKEHHLRTIENISSVKELDIGNNRNLESISNLPKLECLRIGGCPALRYMHNLEELRCIKIYDGEMEALPAWLAGMPQLHRLDISGNANLLRRCFVEDGQDWPKIHCIPQVHGRTLDGSMYLSLSYTKHSLMIHTNIVPTTTTMAVEDVDIDFDAASSASSTIDSYISSY